MREIKFRFYSERLKGVSPPISLDGLMQSPMLKLFGEGLTDMIAMQYTGLKDKNGVEIYEGDIVRLRFHEAPAGESFENGEIKWHPESVAFKWYSGEPSDLNNYWLSHADDKYREVIGNIYENPELLK